MQDLADWNRKPAARLRRTEDHRHDSSLVVDHRSPAVPVTDARPKRHD